MMKVLSVVGARPQFVKLAPIAYACERAKVQHIIVHTGQHYDPQLSDVFFSSLNIPKPDENLAVGSGDHAIQTSAMMPALAQSIANHKPDWVLTYGDTNSTLAAAIVAAKLPTKVAHLEAGLRSFNRQMPEEINRIVTDHVSDLLLAPTCQAMEHLEHEGLESSAELVGDVMSDMLYQTLDRVKDGDNPITTSLPPRSEKYIVATIHRPQNTDDAHKLESILQALSDLEFPVALLAHPRLVAKAREHSIQLSRPGVYVHEPLTYPDLVAAVSHAHRLVTDSGGLQKEAFLLRVPCVTVRPETEWVETVHLGWNRLVSPGPEIIRAVAMIDPAPTTAQPYGDGHAADRVINQLKRHLSAETF